MRVIAALCLVLGLAAREPCAFAAPLVDQPYSIGFQDRYVTNVWINGEGPFEFLVDTASSRTVLFEHTRERLKLQAISAERITVYSISGVTQAYPYQLKELRLADERIEGVTVVVLSDPKNPKDEPDGVLGIDILELYFVVLDRMEGRLKLYPRAEAVPAPYDRWAQVRLTPRRLPGLSIDFWFFNSYVEHKLARTLFDLGAGVTIINWKLANELRIYQYRFPSAPAEVRDVTGHKSPVIRVENVKIDFAGRRWARESVVVADARLFDLLEMSDDPGAIIGSGLLKQESIAIDFERHHLLIAPRE